MSYEGNATETKIITFSLSYDHSKTFDIRNFPFGECFRVMDLMCDKCREDLLSQDIFVGKKGVLH